MQFLFVFSFFFFSFADKHDTNSPFILSSPISYDIGAAPCPSRFSLLMNSN